MPTTATWVYQERVITSIKDMPQGTYGFVYEVWYKPTDIKYIGLEKGIQECYEDYLC